MKSQLLIYIKVNLFFHCISYVWVFFFPQSTPEYDKHIHDEEYLADIISKWEQ